MKKIVLLLGILLMSTVIFSCAPKVVPVEKPTAPEALAQETQITGKEAWEAEWAKTLKNAQKEARLSIYADMTPGVRDVLSREIRKRLGIEVEFATGRDAQMAEKLLRERKAGIFGVDIYMSGLITMINNLKPAGVFQPLEPVLFLPEILDTNVWYEGKLPFVDKDKLIYNISLAPAGPIKVNAELVKEGEIKSYQDLLNPKWRGKIVLFDPLQAGMGLQWFSVYGGYILDYDYMRQLARQEPVIIRDQRLQAEWVSRGKYPISIAVGDTHFTPFREAGALVNNIIMEEGDYLSGGAAFLGFIDRAPHPSAAKLFINWLLTKEGQTIHSHIYERQSVREDVPLSELIRSKGAYRVKGIKYFTGVNTEEFELKKPIFVEKAREIFAPLMK